MICTASCLQRNAANGLTAPLTPPLTRAPPHDPFMGVVPVWNMPDTVTTGKRAALSCGQERVWGQRPPDPGLSRSGSGGRMALVRGAHTRVRSAVCMECCSADRAPASGPAVLLPAGTATLPGSAALPDTHCTRVRPRPRPSKPGENRRHSGANGSNGKTQRGTTTIRIVAGV